MFKYDLHVHTSEISPCGCVSAIDLVGLYKKSGYDGVIITDHFREGFFTDHPSLSWEECCQYYFSGFEASKNEGLKQGLSVFWGLELRLEENFNDYLIFGLPMEFILNNPHFTTWTLEHFREATKDLGILIVQAHPLRPGLTVMGPRLVDGVEGYNGNNRHNNQNSKVQEYARENGLICTSGSDFHELQDLAKGGIMTQEPIIGMQDLINILKSGKYELIQSA